MLSASEKLVRRAERAMTILLAGEVIRRMGGSTSVHEASHAIVAITLGCQIDCITNVADGPWAGHMALTMSSTGPYFLATTKYGELPDRRHAVWLAYAATEGLSRWKGMREKIRFAESLARHIIVSNRDSINRIAERLDAERTLTGDQLREIHLDSYLKSF